MQRAEFRNPHDPDRRLSQGQGFDSHPQNLKNLNVLQLGDFPSQLHP
jgi:hypothetical protein